MKKLDLNRKVTDIAGNEVSVANLQRRLAPGSQPNSSLESTVATFAVIAFSTLENQRGRQLSDAQVKTIYALLKKINSSIVSNSMLDVDDAEYEIVSSVFENQVISIREPFLSMVDELNSVVG